MTIIDDGEQVRVEISVSDGPAEIEDGVGIGTIRNTEEDPDPEPEPDPLTASFSSVPDEPDGGEFFVHLDFSEEVRGQLPDAQGRHDRSSPSR